MEDDGGGHDGGAEQEDGYNGHDGLYRDAQEWKTTAMAGGTAKHGDGSDDHGGLWSTWTTTMAATKEGVDAFLVNTHER
jgi:hypothetical protein